ncbi:MAG: extracellular solute-binding protein [Lachnospiraceae bacterium]|nr:extracellular solute-binding protein [Lachnospiraceae bacterium]
MKKLSKGFIRKGFSVAMAAVLSMSLLACGNQSVDGKNATDGESDGTGENSGYVYVPEYFQMEADENTHMSSTVLQKDKLYYSTYTYNEETGESTRGFKSRAYDSIDTEEILNVAFEGREGYDNNMGDFFFDSEGNMYATWYSYPVYVEGEEYDDTDNTTYLTKYDSAMNQVWAQDIGEVLTDENGYIQKAVIGKDGKIYASSSSVIFVFTGEGAYEKTIPLNTDWINDIIATDDGKILIMQYGMNGLELAEVDTATGALGATYSNLPDYNSKIKSGSEGKLLISGSSKLYEYDMATQESTVILDWIDCNIDGNYASDFCMLEDGRIAVFYDNYDDAPEVVLLTKTPASQVVQKEIITLATLYEGNSTLQQAVVAFNKASSEYQIKIRTYIDNTAEWTETTYSDAISRLNADIVGNDCPDIIDLSNADLNNLAGKGALEDLTSYLETSTAANKADFVPSVLDAYNIDGVQAAVPKYFSIATLLGKTSVVGEEAGWTLDEVIALADVYPDAQLMQYVTKESALRICMQFAGESFIDYETGKCNFDSPEFVKVLEFANRFVEEYDYSNEESLPSMIQSGKVLLSATSFGDVQQYQMYNLMFEDETTSIGYPTVDGSAGIFLSGSEIYGISAKSECKDGAWRFLESVLSDVDEESDWQFPSRTDELEKVFEEAMEPEYQYDEKGEIMYDESNGPLQSPKIVWGYDDWEAEIYAATQEEIDEIREMIEIARPYYSGDETIYSMISEDAAAFFEGQKSAEDVAKTIQSRIEIYVSEQS